MCPSLACLDVKMYNFLNSEACICTVADLHAIRNYASDAQGHLKTALIGALFGSQAPYLCLRFILQAWARGSMVASAPSRTCMPSATLSWTPKGT